MTAVSRATVGRALAEEHEPTYRRALGGSSFDGFAAGVRWLLASTPTMPAATIAERLDVFALVVDAAMRVRSLSWDTEAKTDVASQFRCSASARVLSPPSPPTHNFRACREPSGHHARGLREGISWALIESSHQKENGTEPGTVLRYFLGWVARGGEPAGRW